ncbi:type IV pilus modification protein PilV [Rhodoferax sp. TBRC 17660]|uniref:Type IV pilus modification protein PilV n=1 Tax=Rhodoferax potami TaxID=3068338 RepID=A0ABU3KSL7_9BURK|nr:type IV pilus modification protein PilV [Rhodoferax sp. TBRC 17660]MDT7520333.1 type IV pilus modification protein PilV [Rhodoferax sp. TBRC 17660]
MQKSICHSLGFEKPNAAKMGGFSLIEVLISVVVLSFGLLGAVGLQASALQSNREARIQSSALALARELAEMIRGNKDVALLTTSNPFHGDFSTPMTAPTPSYCLKVSNSLTTAAATPCAGANTTETQTNIANASMTEWLARVEEELPGARVVVCDDAAPYTAGGQPQWACTAGTDATKVVKIGWTKTSTNKALTAASAIEKATGAGAAAPSVILALTPGNSL